MVHCPHCEQPHSDGMDYCPRTGRPIADVAERMVGRTIAGKYKLIGCVGQGGMGTIFEAEHALIGNRVAVKMLHEPFAERREPVQRLYREAQATGAIGHPNIIKVHDVGETEDGIPFLVMELLKGESLGDHITHHGPRPLGFVLDVAIQMLSALQAAHEAGIIHRDLKSDNIFILKTDDGQLQIKILDFGISKFTTPDMDGLKLTQTGTLLGTPYYMAPEQASGKSDLDRRIDLYAAGVILYETLMGVVPHRSTNYNALLIEIITEDVPPFRGFRPDVPARLEAAVLRGLSRSRDLRWSSAVEMMEELVAIRKEVPASVLHGTPVVGEAGPLVDRDSATLDVSDASFERALMMKSQLAFETGGATVANDLGSGVWRMAPLVLGGLGLLAVGGLIAVWLGGGFSADPLPAPAVGEPDAAVIAEPDASAPTETLATDIQLTVTREPLTAVVTAAGQVVPAEGLKIPKGDVPLEVLVEAEGYDRRVIVVVPVADLELEVVLVPTPAAASGGKPPKPKGGGKKPVGGGKPKGGTAKPPEDKPGDKPPLDRPMDNPF